MTPGLSAADRLRTDAALGVDFVPRCTARGIDRGSAIAPVMERAEVAVKPERRAAASAHASADPKADPSAELIAIPSAISSANLIADPSANSSAALQAFVRPGEDRAVALARLQAHHAQSCPHCCNTSGYTNLVFGEGCADARLVFVGEAPGETEDLTGRPFVGRAGQKLDEMIRAMGLSREQIYIANILKARPPNNRTPLPDEVLRCGPTLLAQLAIINPAVIVTLGAPSTKFLLQTEVGISRLRGVWGNWTAPESMGGMSIPVMPTYHPAYLLRNYTAETRAAVWSDLQQVMGRLAEPSSNTGRSA